MTSTRHHGITLKHCPQSCPLLAAGMATEKVGEICTPFFKLISKTSVSATLFVNCPVNECKFDFFFSPNCLVHSNVPSSQRKGGEKEKKSVFEKPAVHF